MEFISCLKRSGDSRAANADRDLRLLAGRLDTTLLANNFARFAGSDLKMDAEEYQRFTKITNLTRQQAASLWSILDQDGSGQVEKAEFTEALENFQQARAWLRFCPACTYQNTCNYCLECNANCEQCSEHSFCAEHWMDHPARIQDGGAPADSAGKEGAMRAHVSTTELLRDQLVIRPLSWMYESPAMAWLPVEQKGTLRRTLRAQQQAAAAAVEKVRAEEEEARLRTSSYSKYAK